MGPISSIVAPPILQCSPWSQWKYCRHQDTTTVGRREAEPYLGCLFYWKRAGYSISVASHQVHKFETISSGRAHSIVSSSGEDQKHGTIKTSPRQRGRGRCDRHVVLSPNPRCLHWCPPHLPRILSEQGSSQGQPFWSPPKSPSSASKCVH